MTTPVRKALHAYLSDEAYEAWHRFAEDCGVSLSAVLTALGPALSDPTEMTNGQKLASVIDQAKDAEREKRRARRKAIAQRTADKANQEASDRNGEVQSEPSARDQRHGKQSDRDQAREERTEES